MKTRLLLSVALLFIFSTSNGQIPNNGFENWPLITNGWPVGTAYQSTDVYPPGVGNYSIRLQNNATTTPDYEDYGFCVTFPTAGSWEPSFPITGHPNSFTGYYKFTSLNGDVAVIAAVLYLNGDTVTSAIMNVPNTTTTWTSFNIPFNSYANADSASIGFSAYFWLFGQTGLPVMQGNSELLIDNINFDNLITSITDQPEENTLFNIYPNPASDIVFLNTKSYNKENMIFSIYNVTGTLVKAGIFYPNKHEINTGNLSSGVYMISIKSDGSYENQRLIIQR